METKKEVINIEGMGIPYEVNINGRLKYMRIRIDINGMKVSIPKKMDKKQIENFLMSKNNWIYKHFTNIELMKDKNPAREWETGEKILYRGTEFNVIVRIYDGQGVRVKFDGREFEILTGRDLIEKEKRDTIEAALGKLFKKMARDIINERLVFFSGIIGVKYNDVRIKEQKTRWGSCSKKGNLNFNWRIIMAPSWVMDYVIVHELCHLKHLNHSKQFWSMVEEYMPDYKKARQWLKENGRILSFR